MNVGLEGEEAAVEQERGGAGGEVTATPASLPL